jgi:hypothetical protein
MTGPKGLETLIVLAVAFALAPLAACGSSVRTPGAATGGVEGVPANYPSTVLESEEHRNQMRAEWDRLFEAYGVAPDRRKVELAPVTHTPTSILGSGPIKLAQSGAALDEERVRLLLREFIAAHADLLGVAANALSLEGVTDAGPIGKRYTFVQAGFPYPIVAPAGRLEFIVSPAAEIIQISDTALPAADLPDKPIVTREAAQKKVLGTAFTYTDIAGRPQTATVTDPAAVTATRLVVYPEHTDTALRVRLAWEVEAGSGLTWTVYVDAVTGDVVGTRQNFQT